MEIVSPGFAARDFTNDHFPRTGSRPNDQRLLVHVAQGAAHCAGPVPKGMPKLKSTGQNGLAAQPTEAGDKSWKQLPAENCLAGPWD
eukprot:s15_g22.t1